MATNLQLTGRAYFSSPLTYGKAVREGQVIRVYDDEAEVLLALDDTFTEYAGVEAVSYDFTDDSTSETYSDGSIAVSPILLPSLPNRIKRGTLLRDRSGYPYGYSDGAGGFVSNGVSASAEAAGVSWRNTAEVNTRAINRLFARSKIVTLGTPGQYMWGIPTEGGIQIPRGGALISSHGVEHILEDQTFEPLIYAERQFDPGIPANGAIAYSGSGANIIGTIPVFPADNAPLKHPVGSFFAILGLDLANQANRSYQGIYQVLAVTDSAITYYMIDYPPSGGNSTAGARIYPVDTGIRILGGLWDGNGPNNGQGGGSPYYQGDPHAHIMSLRNVRDVIVSGVEFRRGYSWSLGTNNIRDCTFRDLKGDLYGDGLGTANAIFQGSGGGRNVLIENVSGTCEDNMVAWSLDTIGQNRTGPTSWTYQDHHNGDVYNLRIRNVHSAKSNATLVNFWGNNNARYHYIEVDGVTGRTSAGGMVGVDNGFDQTDMFNTNGGILKIKNVSGEGNAGLISIRSDGTWELIEIDTVNHKRPVNGLPCVSFLRRPAGGYAPTTQTIKRVVLKNLDARTLLSTNSRTGPLAEIADTNIDDLVVDGATQMRINANTGVIVHSGTVGVIKQAVVTGLRGEVVGAFSDACLVKCDNSGAGALGTLVLRDCAMTGFTDGTPRGGLVHQTASGKVGKVRLDNTPAPTLIRSGSLGTTGILRDGTGMAVEVVSFTPTAAN